MTRSPSGLAKAWSSLRCLVGVRDGLERFGEYLSGEYLGVRCRGDLNQPATGTIRRVSTPLCAWLEACGRAVASHSSRLIGGHQPEVGNRCAADSAVRRMSPALTIGRIAFVNPRRLNATRAQIRCSCRSAVCASTPIASRPVVCVRQCQAMPAI